MLCPTHTAQHVLGIIMPIIRSPSNCRCSLWFPIIITVFQLYLIQITSIMDTKKLYWRNDNHKRPLLNNRHMFYQLLVNKTLSFMMIGNQRLQQQFDGILMMDIIMPETCWAVSVRQSNKILWLIVASSWGFHLRHIYEV